ALADGSVRFVSSTMFLRRRIRIDFSRPLGLIMGLIGLEASRVRSRQAILSTVRRPLLQSMKKPRINIGTLRRQEIVEAAVAVITEQGFQNLSLSEIEKKAGMSRGQLTYYFPTKEAILLAVFDRLLYLMYERIGRPESDVPPFAPAGGWEWVQH